MQIFHLPRFIQQQDHKNLRLRRLHIIYCCAPFRFLAYRHMQHFDGQIALLTVSGQNKRVGCPYDLRRLLRAYREDNIDSLQLES